MLLSVKLFVKVKKDPSEEYYWKVKFYCLIFCETYHLEYLISSQFFYLQFGTTLAFYQIKISLSCRGYITQLQQNEQATVVSSR